MVLGTVLCWRGTGAAISTVFHFPRISVRDDVMRGRKTCHHWALPVQQKPSQGRPAEEDPQQPVCLHKEY